MTTLKDKINLFYKLALFGDRADFLNSVAQAVLPAGPVDLHPTLSPKPVPPVLHNGKWSDLKDDEKQKIFNKIMQHQPLNEKEKQLWMSKSAQAGAVNLHPTLAPKPVQPVLQDGQWSDMQSKTQTLPETTITGDVLKGKDLYNLFTRVYKALKTGQAVSEQDRDYWLANSKVFKDRSNALQALITKANADPNANPYQVDQWKEEMNAINFVFSKQV